MYANNHFLLYIQDLKEHRSVIASMVDFEKAFYRQTHNILIAILKDLGVPGRLLDVIIGYLEDRTLIVAYKCARSESKQMPVGGAQGTLLGIFLFLILINGAR